MDVMATAHVCDCQIDSFIQIFKMASETPSFKSLLIKTDVTALKLIEDDFLIIGLSDSKPFV